MKILISERAAIQMEFMRETDRSRIIDILEKMQAERFPTWGTFVRGDWSLTKKGRFARLTKSHCIVYRFLGRRDKHTLKADREVIDFIAYKGNKE